MKLIKLLNNIPYEIIKGNIDIDIQDISYDSRNISKDMAFVAIIGIDIDGHNYIKEAIKKGVSCFFVSKNVTVDENVTIIKLTDTRKYLANLSANLFDNPATELTKIAITGTKGKTSISWMLKSILETANYKVGVIGTIGTIINNELYPHKNTTPESYQIQKYMRKMVDCGITHLIMEVSSQALKVGRVSNINFEYGIFTNLSIDHVGPREHSSYDDYVYSKSLLFKQCNVGIFNKDDLEYQKMIENATCKIHTYGKENCDLSFDNVNNIHEDKFLGNEFTTKGIVNNVFRVAAPGNFSVYNALAAIFVAHLLNINNNDINKGLKEFTVAGRCQVINIKNTFKVIIDFAHNKISMESIIKTMKEYHPNRIITVFGCGGGRSTERRYELGVISGSLSTLSIVTTDNPRNDDIDDINKDIVSGIKSTNGDYLVIKDREEAINYVLQNAQKNDIILLLGKGHEKYQEIKGVKYPFNENAIIEKFIESR